MPAAHPNPAGQFSSRIRQVWHAELATLPVRLDGRLVGAPVHVNHGDAEVRVLEALPPEQVVVLFAPLAGRSEKLQDQRSVAEDGRHRQRAPAGKVNLLTLEDGPEVRSTASTRLGE